VEGSVLRRRVVYLTGTRADFGLMLPTLLTIAARPGLELELVVTGMHLSARYGHTLAEVRASGLPIHTLIPVDVDQDSGLAMARAASCVAKGMTEYMAQRRPQICLLLGDRWEMLATAMIATLAGVPIFHLCGGERSGSVDDAMRHAVSKLAHMHGVATIGARDRLLALGEEPWRIHQVGTPGLVGLTSLDKADRATLARQYGLHADAPIALVLFHPVVQEAEWAGAQMASVLAAVHAQGLQMLCLMPNADAGNTAIRHAIEVAKTKMNSLRVVTHLPRQDYLSWLAVADLLVGNSSSGIIEAASLGIPVVNIGDRQLGRERNANTFDCLPDTASVEAAIRQAKAYSPTDRHNIYGDGQTNVRVADLIEHIPINAALLNKRLTY
jgi:GDP/UDP-N,N'-diacetylbacillosamine 2-epimerase (hydrolysing)